MPLSRPAGVRMLSLMRALVLAGAVGATAAAGDSAPRGCGRFTLEKIPLDATQAQVEALGIGKLEPLLVGTEESRFRVRPPHTSTQKQINILFLHGRVVDVELIQFANAATAETFLADLRGRWGDPDKPIETDLPKNLPRGYKWFTWSDRSCPAYGGYFWNAFQIRIVMSVSVNRVKSLPDDRPLDAR